MSRMHRSFHNSRSRGHGRGSGGAAYGNTRSSHYENSSASHPRYNEHSSASSSHGNSHSSKYYSQNSSSISGSGPKSHYKKHDEHIQERGYAPKRPFKEVEQYSQRDSGSNRRSPEKKRSRREEPSHSSRNSSRSASSNYYGNINSRHESSRHSRSMSGGGGGGGGSGVGGVGGLDHSSSHNNGGNVGGGSSYRQYATTRMIGGHFKAPHQTHRPPVVLARHDLRKELRMRNEDNLRQQQEQEQQQQQRPRRMNDFNRETRLIRRRVPIGYGSNQFVMKHRFKNYAGPPNRDYHQKEYRGRGSYRVKRIMHTTRTPRTNKNMVSNDGDLSDNDNRKSDENWDDIMTTSKVSKKDSGHSKEIDNSDKDDDFEDLTEEIDKEYVDFDDAAGDHNHDDDEDDKENGNDDSDAKVLDDNGDDGDEEEDHDQDQDQEINHIKSRAKYACVHCLFQSSSSADYKKHLKDMTHMSAMRRIAKKQRTQLMKMRLDQRNEQRRIERNPKNVTKRTIFCPLCKLNFRQLKSIHQTSNSHKAMRKFLMPYCRLCDVSFRSPMFYETHLCSLNHIAKKIKKAGSNQNVSSPIKEHHLSKLDNLDTFMTIDSIGEIDENSVEAAKRRRENIEKAEIIVGKNYIRVLKVLQCDVCQRYIPLEGKEENEVIRLHCSSRLHMNSYVNFKECIDLKKKAERIQDLSDSESHVPIEITEVDVKNELVNPISSKNSEITNEFNTNRNTADDSEFIVVNNMEFTVNSNDENLEEKDDDGLDDDEDPVNNQMN